MTTDRQVSSIEASFNMEDMPFDKECRKRVEDILINKVSVASVIADLNKKYKSTIDKR